MDFNELVMVNVKGIKAYTRPGTSDEFVVDEVIRGNAYRKLKIKPGDVVLDAGMNIGMFTVRALQAGAVVHSFEPEPGNFQVARANVQANGFGLDRAHLNCAALTGTHEPTRTFSINVKKNKGAHSLVAKKGRTFITVKCEEINHVLERVRPRVVKMDIEGGEYECLKAVKSFAGIEQMQLEYHHAHLDDIKTRTKYREIVGLLKSAFPRVDYREETKKAWVSLIYCSR
jgi:FkbM family methyltransferase